MGCEGDLAATSVTLLIARVDLAGLTGSGPLPRGQMWALCLFTVKSLGRAWCEEGGHLSRCASDIYYHQPGSKGGRKIVRWAETPGILGLLGQGKGNLRPQTAN